MNNQRILDISYGESGEKITKNVIEKYFNMEFNKTNDFHNMDFHNSNNNIYIEVKSRRIKKDKYKSVYFSLSKYKFIKRNPKNKYYFVYNFIDGFYIFEYDENKIFFSIGGRSDRGINEYYKLCNIPTKYLIKI